MENGNARGGHYIRAVLVIAAGVFLDQLTKYLAAARLKDGAPFLIWKGVFQLEYLENRGAAFGLFQNQRFFFILSVVLVCAVIVLFYARVPMERRFLPLRVCAVMIAAGALGNVIDRVRLGFVIDFFYFVLIDFPIFNVADIYVTVATALLLILICFYYKEEDLDRIIHSGKRGGRAD